MKLHLPPLSTGALLLGNCVASTRASADPLPSEVDVVIVGAGASGLAAASRLQEFAEEHGITYAVLEAQSKVGGRVQSRVLDFGSFVGNYTVEDGANWITDFPGNPIFALAQEYDVGMILQEFFDIDAYQGSTPIPKKDMDFTQKEFVQAWNCLQQFTNVPYNNGGKDGFGQSQLDIGAIALLEQCGWEVSDDPDENIKYFWQWYYMEFEYAQNNVSLATFPEDAFFKPTYLVSHQNGGFQGLFERFLEEKINPDNVFLDNEVTLIDYTDSVPTGNPGYNAKVHVDGVADPILCKRVITTLSVGILEEKKETLFEPDIDTDLLALEMMQYIKIFYQFEKKFWGDEEFILTMNEDPTKRGYCEHWQNLATTGKGGNTNTGRKGTTNEFTSEDSNILFCTIITESYLALVEEDGELSDATLDSFLEPLADAFGSDYELPRDKFYFAWNLNEYSGGGSFSNWQVQPQNTWEDNVEAFSYFWGGWGSPYGNVPDGWYRSVNGYQDDGDGGEEWVVHLSGTGSCFESWGFVHGGFWAGLRSANYILHEWGLVKESATLSPCEDF